jgi:hypothetical protein
LEDRDVHLEECNQLLEHQQGLMLLPEGCELGVVAGQDLEALQHLRRVCLSEGEFLP